MTRARPAILNWFARRLARWPFHRNRLAGKWAITLALCASGYELRQSLRAVDNTRKIGLKEQDKWLTPRFKP